MVVVSNTSPILNLAIIGQLSLLSQQFGDIWIPPAVMQELRIGEDLPGSLAVRIAIEAGWLRTKEVENFSLVQVLNRDLDKGEAESIALALQLKAALILLDERDGRKAAKSLGLSVTGVLGILLRAWHEGKIQSLPEMIENLKDKAGFRIEAELLAEFMGEIGKAT
jgi:predicted nucleic acid-binding protein